MKELIKIRPNYKIENYQTGKQFINVCNYDSSNTVINFGFDSKKEILRTRDFSDVGCWQPKGTKEKELKSK